MSLVITTTDRHLWLVSIFCLILGNSNLRLAADEGDPLEPCPQPGYPTTGGLPLPPHCANSTDTQLRQLGYPDYETIPSDLPPPYGPSLLGSPIDLPDRCGRAPLNRLRVDSDEVGYVINGYDQQYGEFPSFVKLEVQLSGYRQSYCGGTLISDRHVLTAAHCVVFEGTRVRASQIRIILGEHRLREIDSHEMESDVSHLCVSPSYQASTHDWALLELSKPVELNDHVQPACLPREPVVTRGRSAKCYLVGLGAIGFGKTPGWDGKLPAVGPRVVQKLNVEQVRCRGWSVSENDKSRSCYTRANDQPGDSCKGDSGGPILCLDARGRWTVTASVSYGTEYCNDEGPAAWVGVYADIQKLVGDIERHCG